MLAHESEGFRTTQVVIARIGGTAFPQSDFRRTDEICLVFFEIIVFLFGCHLSVGVGVILVLRFKKMAHLADFRTLFIDGSQLIGPERRGFHSQHILLAQFVTVNMPRIIRCCPVSLIGLSSHDVASSGQCRADRDVFSPVCAWAQVWRVRHPVWRAGVVRDG